MFNGNTLSVAVGFACFEYYSGATFVTNTWLIDETGSFYWEGRIVIPESQAFGWVSSAGAGTAELDVYLGGYTLQAA